MLPNLLTNPIFGRALLALMVIAVGLLAYRLAGYFTLAWLRTRQMAPDSSSNGKPVLLYFTTPTCAPCKTLQRPAIHRLQELAGDRLQIVEIDASLQPEIADQWGVFSVPTTFIVDSNGAPRYVNHGVASAEKLFDQFNHTV
ncbi:MAG: hypothetical protein B6D39_01815 [Anaerolineae bacterium UTCFX2]|jgi:thiol-disulfide isomerase/thioredoxin|nr:thioredoxin family protein [Anaerolineae bacterium]MCZ7552700.1 thioredoxin family protein [Anaerolineales bacterium]OQY94242.1 MAG: hypothetical protein B6D39_01815 [Anaerolineae bacterium UTCFX2]